MSKNTLEQALMARTADPRAMRGTITLNGGKLMLTFGAVGQNRRLSIAVDGDDLSIADDPRVEADEAEPDTADAAPAEKAVPDPKDQPGNTRISGGTEPKTAEDADEVTAEDAPDGAEKPAEGSKPEKGTDPAEKAEKPSVKAGAAPADDKKDAVKA